MNIFGTIVVAESKEIDSPRRVMRMGRMGLLLCLVGLLAFPGCALLKEPAGAKKKGAEAEAVYARLMQRSQALMTQRKFSRAMSMLHQAAMVQPWKADPWVLRGECLFRMDRYAEAVEAYERALARDPQSVPAGVRRWAALLEAEENTSAIKGFVKQDIRTLLAVHPREPSALYAAFLGYGLLGADQERRTTFKQWLALAQGPSWRNVVRTTLASMMLEDHDPARREAWASRYLREFGQDSDADLAARILAGAVAQRASTMETFMRNAHALLEEIPDSPFLHLALARVLIEARLEISTAIRWLDQALALWDGLDSSGVAGVSGPSQHPLVAAQWKSKALTLLGLAHVMQDRVARARPLFEQAVQMAPWQGEAWHYLGLIAVNTGRIPEARALFARALETGHALPNTSTLFAYLVQGKIGKSDVARIIRAREEGVVTFTDVTAESGLSGLRSGRVAWGDVDHDGHDDLLLDGPRLLWNNGSGQFVDLTAYTGLDAVQGARGGIWGDYNNDGFVDVFVFVGQRNRLMQNHRGWVFTNVTETVLPEPTGGPTEAAAWGDLDRDGWLDLYVANYERAGVELGLCVQDRLLLNQQGRRLIDRSQDAGILTDEAMCGRGVVWADINHDGWQDILVSNYRLDPNFLWINNRDETVQDRAHAMGFRGHNDGGAFGHSIASVVGDLDGDGDRDVFTSNLAHPRTLPNSDLSVLLMNVGPPTFLLRDRFAESGILYEETSADAALGDVDNDGDLDLYVTSVYPGRGSHLYLNDGHGRFRDVTWLSGTRVNNAWGAAFADYDRDGDLDLFVAGQDGVHLFRNDGTGHHWLTVQVRSRHCNRLGVGATVTVTSRQRTQRRTLTAGKGTGTQDALAAHFGLGEDGGPLVVEVHDLCGGEARTEVATPDRVVTMTPSPGDMGLGGSSP